MQFLPSCAVLLLSVSAGLPCAADSNSTSAAPAPGQPGATTPETKAAREQAHPYYTFAELPEAQRVARQLHRPLAWIDGNLAALALPNPPYNSEDELTQMAVNHLKPLAVTIFLGADTNLSALSPVIRDQQLFQLDDGPLPDGHHFYVPKIAFSDPEVTKALGRVSYTQMAASREAAIDSVLQSFTGASDTSPASIAPGTNDSDYQLKTPYHTEEEWIIGSICRNAYEMLSLISDKKGEVITRDQISVKKAPGHAAAYDVVLHGKTVTVTVTLHWPGSIWSSQAYVPFCQAAMTQLKLSPTPAGRTEQGNPLAALLDFSEQSIQSENIRVSQWLTAEPDNPLAQQQAALVLGTLAMKENSGWFWDPRDVCNHVTAHLAIARSLAPGADLSVEGKLADCCVGLICDTKKECARELDDLSQMKDAPKELDAWVRASRMRNSRDWRIIDKPENASGFEQLEYFRALGEAISPDQAVSWLQAKSIPNRQDWTRLVLQLPYSVDNGHTFAMPSVASEIALMQTIFPDRFKKETLVKDLNELSGDVLALDAKGTSGLYVITNGMWAQFFQRHLCHALANTGSFLQVMLGAPDEAAQFDRAATERFSGLELFPYLRHVDALRCKWPEDPKAILSAFVQHPELGQAYLNILAPDDNGGGVDLPKYHNTFTSWFSPPILSGTAYDPFSRMDNVAGGMKEHPAAIEYLYTIAPLQFRIAELELITRYSKTPTSAQVKEIMGDMPDYYLDALDWATKAPDISDDQRFALERKAAGFDPERNLVLAKDLIVNGRENDAAVAYQEMHDKDPDQVAVSDSMEWLVNYYYDHGQKDKAITLAKEGAEVYSETGLTTMMNLLVRMGQLTQAEDIGGQIKGRYNDSIPLIMFYKKQTDGGDATYKAKFDSALQDIFPSGLKPVTLASFTVPPTVGMQFSATSPGMTQNGLTSDDIVVALDGYEVDTVAEYALIRAFTDLPAMDLIIWDGQAYREIKATQAGRRFGVGMLDYKK